MMSSTNIVFPSELEQTVLTLPHVNLTLQTFLRKKLPENVSQGKGYEFQIINKLHTVVSPASFC